MLNFVALKKSGCRILGVVIAISCLGASAQAGGVSGGGGGIIPPEAVDPALIRAAIQQSRLALYLFFNDQGLRRRGQEVPSGALLFDGTRTIFDIIQTATIELSEASPCLDPVHEEKDGAAPGSQPNSVCISVKDLSAKLTLDNYYSQTVALVGHEFSHLLGMEESQAGGIQKGIIGALRPLPSSFASTMRIDSADRIGGALAALRYLMEYPAVLGDPEQTNNYLLRVMNGLDAMLGAKVIFADDLSALDARQSDLWWGAYWKLQMFSYAACARDHSPGNPRAGICQEWIDRIFGENAELDLPTLETRMNSRTGSLNPKAFTIRRIGTDAQSQLELDDLVELLAALTRSLQALPAAWSGYVPGTDIVPSTNAVTWKTDRVSVSADDFHITAGGMNFYGNPTGLQLHSDPGDQGYWTFESSWLENGREMRLFIYFKADATHWWADEIRIYDGRTPGEWVTFQGKFFASPLGVAFNGELDLNGVSEKGAPGSLHLRGLKVQIALH